VLPGFRFLFELVDNGKRGWGGGVGRVIVGEVTWSYCKFQLWSLFSIRLYSTRSSLVTNTGCKLVELKRRPCTLPFFQGPGVMHKWTVQPGTMHSISEHFFIYFVLFEYAWSFRLSFSRVGSVNTLVIIKVHLHIKLKKQ